MSFVKLFLDISGSRKPPSIEFNPEGLPFKLTVKHIKGMVQVETDVSMKNKSLIGPDGELHADSVPWEKTGWKCDDTLRIVDTPPATALAAPAVSAPPSRTASKEQGAALSRRNPFINGGSLMLSSGESVPIHPEGAGSKFSIEDSRRASKSEIGQATDIEALLASLSAPNSSGDSADISARPLSTFVHPVDMHKSIGSASICTDQKSDADLELQAERKALLVLQEKQAEISSRSEACSLKLERLKVLLQEDGGMDEAIRENLMTCDLSIPRLPLLSKWNARDFMTYLQSVALLQTRLESWSAEAGFVAGAGISADVLREQLPQCAQFISVFSQFVIACIREAAEAALTVLGQAAKSVWDEWSALEGAKDLDQIHDKKSDISQAIPSWYSAPDSIAMYLDATIIETNPGRWVLTQMREWVEAVPFAATARVSDFDSYAHPESFYWRKMTIRQRAAMIYLIEKAGQDDRAFHQALESAVSHVGDAQYKHGPVKSLERTAAKAVTDEGGDAFKIKDFLRALVVCPTPAQAVAAYQAFEGAGSHIKIIKCKNGFVKDYWGHNLKVAMLSVEVSGVLGEVQICPSEMFRIRDMMHHYYDFARAASVDDFR